ncbi:MAG: hypothetical protein ACTSRW_09360 [Candidatus Helarchaeota archaeon]
MEKIIEIIDKLEEYSTEKSEIEALDNLKKRINMINSINNQIIENEKKAGSMSSISKGSNFDEDLEQLKRQVSKGFTNLFKLSSKIELRASPKAILAEKIEKVFEDIADENIWGISIYDEIVNDIKLRLKRNLIDKVTDEDFVTDKSSTDFKSVQDLLSKELDEINQHLSGIKKEYGPQLKLQAVMKELYDELLPKLTKSIMDLRENSDKMTLEIQNELSSIRGKPKQLLKNIRGKMQDCPTKKRPFYFSRINFKGH